MKRTLLVVFALSLPFLAVGQCSAASDTTYYDATNSLIDLSNPVGTQWHELYPLYCTGPYTLTEWKDNGDGVLSPCDTIVMVAPDETESCEHVTQVTYTLELTPLQEPIIDTWWDFTEHGTGGDPLTEPVCSYWHEVYPDFCMERHINGWDDTGNGSGKLDSCDVIIDDYGNAFHVEGVHTDIVTEPSDGCPVDQSTWGSIKALFR